MNGNTIRGKKASFIIIDEPRAPSKPQEYATVELGPDMLHIVVFSADGHELERYDIQRDHRDVSKYPKRLELEDMREWMKRGCPAEGP